MGARGARPPKNGGFRPRRAVVFFVLMSMFIALISEAYASVREETDKLIVPRIRRMGYSDLRAVTGEARRRMELSRDSNLISNKLYRDLRPFQQALDGQFARREEREAEEERARALDDAVEPRSCCRRGAGAIAPDGEAAPRGGCCSSGSEYCPRRPGAVKRHSYFPV
jgi:hypothetical protein